jgi:hypothetical protein
MNSDTRTVCDILIGTIQQLHNKHLVDEVWACGCLGSLRGISNQPISTLNCRKRYDIHNRRFFDTVKDRVVLVVGLPTLKAARLHREVSGDIVVYHGTNKVVPSTEWLFDWEVKDLNCYARKAINHSKKV